MQLRHGVSRAGPIFLILCAAAFGIAMASGAADERASAPAPARPATDYQIPWHVITDGGGSARAGNFVIDGTVGGPPVGSSASDEYQIGGGYWYGITTCNCGTWGDVSNDGSINPLDVVRMVNFVYRGQSGALIPPVDFVCPRPLGDISCDGLVNPIDVVRYVNFVYKGQSNAFCSNPCL